MTPEHQSVEVQELDSLGFTASNGMGGDAAAAGAAAAHAPPPEPTEPLTQLAKLCRVSAALSAEYGVRKVSVAAPVTPEAVKLWRGIPRFVDILKTDILHAYGPQMHETMTAFLGRGCELLPAPRRPSPRSPS